MINFWNVSAMWAFAGAGAAVMLEFIYRKLPGPFWSFWWAVIPANVLISYTVYKLVTTPGATLIDAFIVWSFSTICLRVVVTIFFLNDTVHTGTWMALAFLLAARLTQTFWR